MFGYVIPDKANMYVKDFMAFRSYYCGLCVALGRTGTPVTRLCVNYDSAFYSALLHCLANMEVDIKNSHCMIHPLSKRPIASVDEISKAVADLSVLLIYYKAQDDVQDGKKRRIFVKARLASRKRVAKKRMPNVDKCMNDCFDALAKLEKENSDSIDRVADTMGVLMRDVTKDMMSKYRPLTEDEEVFTYCLGKIVYILDAIDDLEEDTKKKRYNPFVAKFGPCENKVEFLEKNKEEISFSLNTTYNDMADAYDRMNVVVAEGVLSNIVYKGIPMQINKLLKGEDKCHTTRL